MLIGRDTCQPFSSRDPSGTRNRSHHWQLLNYLLRKLHENKKSFSTLIERDLRKYLCGSSLSILDVSASWHLDWRLTRRVFDVFARSLSYCCLQCRLLFWAVKCCIYLNVIFLVFWCIYYILSSYDSLKIN